MLGFPCDQFGHQEPGDEGEIQQFCSTKYHVTFPMFAKIEVNGPRAHPLYQFLKSEKSGLLGTEAIKWNFTKFLISREGEVVKRYAPTTTPEKVAADLALRCCDEPQTHRAFASLSPDAITLAMLRLPLILCR